MQQEFGTSKDQLPDFLIVGAAKAGTSSIANYLNQHPDIYIPKNKELRFFIKDSIHEINERDPLKRGILEQSVLNLEDYKNLFDQKEKIKGDASVHYLYHHKECISNIRKFKDYEPKIIIILRNPIDRIISNYEFLYDVHGNNFEDELELEQERKNLNYNCFWYYRELSMYYTQVKAYLDNFQSVHVLLFEDLIKDKEKAMNELYHFLGVNTFTPEFHVVNKSAKQSNLRRHLNKIGIDKLVKKHFTPKWRNKIKIALGFALTDTKKHELTKFERAYLNNYFKHDIEKLELLLQRDLSSWKR